MEVANAVKGVRALYLVCCASCKGLPCIGDEGKVSSQLEGEG